jgi:hypothetical protein
MSTETGRPAKKKPEKKPKKRKLTMAWAYLLGAVITAFPAGYAVGFATTHQSAKAPGRSSRHGLTTEPRVVPLHFSVGSPGNLPWCSALTGAGSIPAGDSLAIFDAAVHDPLYYHFDGFATRASSDSWSLSPFYVGTRHEVGLRDQVSAVLVNGSTASFLRSILAGPPGTGAFWVTNVLPPGLSHRNLLVTRGADSIQCATAG